MKITAIFEVESISDFYTALTVLRQNIKKETKDLGLNPTFDEFPANAALDDNNCYGSFEVEIIPEGNDFEEDDSEADLTTHHV